jgi:hypothetical protein
MPKSYYKILYIKFKILYMCYLNIINKYNMKNRKSFLTLKKYFYFTINFEMSV